MVVSEVTELLELSVASSVSKTAQRTTFKRILIT